MSLSIGHLSESQMLISGLFQWEFNKQVWNILTGLHYYKSKLMALEDKERDFLDYNFNISSHLSILYYLKISVADVVELAKTDVEIQTYLHYF